MLIQRTRVLLALVASVPLGMVSSNVLAQSNSVALETLTKNKESTIQNPINLAKSELRDNTPKVQQQAKKLVAVNTSKISPESDYLLEDLSENAAKSTNQLKNQKISQQHNTQNNDFVRLHANDPDSRIFLRSSPSTSASKKGYGLVGDRVKALTTTEGQNGYIWYKVRFPESGATGWIRGDLIRTSETPVEDPARGENIHRSDRANYNQISPDRVASNSNTTLTGDNPKKIVRRLLGFSDLRESRQQDIEIDYPHDNKAVVTLTQTGLLDDSVEGMRYRVELISSGNKWKVIWIGEQYKCNPRRGGHTDWSTELCP
jgi:hypothetical protein